MTDIDIIDYFDTHLDVTVREMAWRSGQTESYVKNLLLNTGAEEYHQMQQASDFEQADIIAPDTIYR